MNESCNAAKTLMRSETGTVNLATSAPLVFEPYAVNKILGDFTLFDKLTLEPVGTGMIDFALRRASNIHWQALDQQSHARRTKTPDAALHLVHRVVGFRQINSRQLAGKAPLCAGAPHLLARWRQRAPWPEPQLGVH